MTTTTYITIEEIGRNEAKGIEVMIAWKLTPGEPMVCYYPDGSGYPGSPPTAETIDLKVTAAWGDGWFVDNREDWLRGLDDYAETRIHTDLWDNACEDAFQAAAHDEDAAREAYADMKLERMRLGE